MIGRMFDWLINTHVGLFGLFCFLLLFLVAEIGFQIGNWSRLHRRHREQELTGVGTITTGMLGLLAFTLGITIGIAQDRYEARRKLVVQEANAIGTAWLRAHLAGEEGPVLAGLIEDYAKVRLAYTTAGTLSAEPELIARTNILQTEIWAKAQAVAARAPTAVTATLINALNDMFDQSLAQRFAFESRVPPNLAWMLLVGSVLAIGAMGFQLGLNGARQVLLVALLLLMWAGAMMLIVDMNRPRIGGIRVNPAPLLWTIQGFGSGGAAAR
jgi:hypothetical protein